MLSSSNSEYNVTILKKSETFWAITRGNCCYWKSLIQKKKWRSVLTWNARNFPCCDWTILLNINHCPPKKTPHKTQNNPPQNQNGIYVIVRKVPSNEFDVPHIFQFYIYIVIKYWWALFCIYYRTQKIKWQQHNLIVFK